MSDVFPPALNVETLAYVAGLFDGEGSIVIGCSIGRTNRKNPCYFLQVGITNTDRELGIGGAQHDQEPEARKKYC